MSVTRGRIVEDLLALGVEKGDHLGLGISLKKVGLVEGGADGFIDGLLEAVGPSGTIMIPTYTRMADLSDLGDMVFDPETSPSYTGAVPEALRKRPGALRSRHPSNSVAALGGGAQVLVEAHDHTAPAYSPYSTLAEMGGKVLMVGLRDKLIGIRHQAQYLAGLLTVIPPVFGVRYRQADGGIGTFVRKDHGGCVRTLPEMVPGMRDLGMVRDGKVGDADSTLSDAAQVLAAMTAILKDNPSLNLCDEPDCDWCRDIEKRLEITPALDRRVAMGGKRIMGAIRRVIGG